jgi:hypothetical protein
MKYEKNIYKIFQWYADLDSFYASGSALKGTRIDSASIKETKKALLEGLKACINEEEALLLQSTNCCNNCQIS